MWLTGLVAPRHVGSSQTRARTRVPCIDRQILNHCTTREAPEVWEAPEVLKFDVVPFVYFCVCCLCFWCHIQIIAKIQLFTKYNYKTQYHEAFPLCFLLGILLFYAQSLLFKRCLLHRDKVSTVIPRSPRAGVVTRAF